MRSLIIISAIFLIACSTSRQKIRTLPSDQSMKPTWSLTESVQNPESTYYHSTTNLTFVSSVNGAPNEKNKLGFISLVGPKGRVINEKWITGLNAPKGMRAYKGYLYVTDIDRVIKIDINKGVIVKKYKVKGASFLNDIAIDAKGRIYISDMLTSKIHLLKKGKVSTFLQGSHLESPNGLYVYGNDLYVAAWGLTTDFSTKVPGRLYKINLRNKKISYITQKPLGNLDGLERDDQGNFYVSDWVNGKIFRVKPNGDTTLVYQGTKGLADIGYHKKRKTLLAPLMFENKIIELE